MIEENTNESATERQLATFLREPLSVPWLPYSSTALARRASECEERLKTETDPVFRSRLEGMRDEALTRKASVDRQEAEETAALRRESGFAD